MSFVSQADRIHARLYSEAETGPFHPVSYDKDSKAQTVAVLEAVQPAEIIVAEVNTSFGTPRRNRRTDRLERLTWRWSVRCSFNQQVSTEEFEKRLIQQNILLARDDTNDLAQVSLKLQASDPFHPPQQSPSTGTVVTFQFEAELSPV